MSSESNKKCCIPNVEHHPELATEAVFALPEEVLAETPPPAEPVAGIIGARLGGPSPGTLTRAWNAPEDSIAASLANDEVVVRNAPQFGGLENTRLVSAIDRKIKDRVLSSDPSQKEHMAILEERAWREKEAELHKAGVLREYGPGGLTQNQEANNRLKQQLAAVERAAGLQKLAEQAAQIGAGIGIGAAKAATLTVGMKHDGGKPPVSLVPQALVYGAARAYGFGAKKYARHNYRLGIQASRLLDAAMRHLTEVAEGKTVDEESGLHPLDHAAAALGMLMDTLERVKQGKISESYNDLYIEVSRARPLEIG